MNPNPLCAIFIMQPISKKGRFTLHRNKTKNIFSTRQLKNKTFDETLNKSYKEIKKQFKSNNHFNETMDFFNGKHF